MKDDDQPPPLDPSKLVDKPFIITFTAHLPFPVGIPNDLGHCIWLGAPFKTEAEAAEFKSPPFVNIRVFEIAESGLPAWRKGTHAAIEKLYGVPLEGDPDTRYGEDEFLEHDQWVTLETPYAEVEGEDAIADPAFTFHRCLHFFNLFLQAALLITKDVRIRPISSHDFRPAVIVGAIPRGGGWRIIALLHMHPEAQPESLLAEEKPFTQEELNEALRALVTSKPYITTMIWRSRAQRSLRQTGDAADAIISFQIAAESLLFDTYRMLLVDEGYSSSEIATRLEGEVPFKSLISKILPAKLGGQWDITREGTAVGEYWEKLYSVRNSIVHRGFHANGDHAGDAQTAYWGLRDHIEARLWAKHKSYPRTLLARVGEEQLAERGWLPAMMQRFVETAKSEQEPFWWPYDIAGRPNN